MYLSIYLWHVTTSRKYRTCLTCLFVFLFLLLPYVTELAHDQHIEHVFKSNGLCTMALYLTLNFNFITYCFALCCITFTNPQGVNRRGPWAGARVPVSVLRDVSGISLLHWRRVPGAGASDSPTRGGSRAGRRTENPPQPLLLEPSQVTLPQETAVRALTQPARPTNPPTDGARPDGIPLTSLWWWLVCQLPPGSPE